MKVHLTTLGCPKNQVDSELMLGLLGEAGFPLAERAEDAECLIVNTCAFIDRAREESVQTILELARLKERGRCRALIVTGCLTQRYGAEVMQEMPEIDGILGTSNLPAIVDLVRQAASRHDWATAAPPGYLYDASTPRLLTAKVPYAYVKIAEGCDMGCTFCAIPQFRGRHRSRPLADIRLAAIMLDGIELKGRCCVVCLGITTDGIKVPLGLWDGSTENKTVTAHLLADLVDRGLDVEQGVLIVLDGSKALRAAVNEVFGPVPVHRCVRHKERNVLDHLPERQRTWAKAILQRAYRSADVATARRLLTDLARRLDTDHPSAAESVREGLDETLTVLGLNLPETLRRSLTTTNAAESLISRTRHVKRNVKRWRGGQMVVRWVAAGVLEAVKGFRRLKGHKAMPQLVAALRARDQQLGLVVDVEKVA